MNNGMAAVVSPGDEAGRVEQRFQTPQTPRSSPLLKGGVERTMPRDKALKIQFVLNKVAITGALTFTDTELAKTYQNLLGKQISAQDAFDIADRITLLYRNRGYLLSRAILPPQAMEKGEAILQIRVLEGYIDNIIWPKEMGNQYDDFLKTYTNMILAERPARADVIERYMLLANDLPGVNFRYFLSPSESLENAATLEVRVSKESTVHQLQLDNRGTSSTGPEQLTWSAVFNNPFQSPGKLNVSFSTAGFSSNPELLYGAINYQRVMTAEGLALNIGANVSHGKPDGTVLRRLDFNTRSENVSIGVNYPVIRSRARNLYTSLTMDFKHSRTQSLGTTVSFDRTRVLRAAWRYDAADAWNGINQFGLMWSKGLNILGSSDSNNPLASRIPGQVAFNKVNIDASRAQALPFNLTARFAGTIQLAPDPLLSSEECGYGGRQFGRGLDSSIIVGDRCMLLSAELSRSINLPERFFGAVIARAEVYGFADHGRVKNINPPLGTAVEDSAASFGFGVRLTSANKLGIDLLFSQITLHPASTAPQDNSRAWLQITKTF